MQVSFDPLNPQEAEAVRSLLALAQADPAPLPEANAAINAAADALDAASKPAAPATPPKSHKKKAAPAPAPEQQATPAAPPTGTPSIGDLLANSTPPVAASTVAENVPAPHVPAPPAPLTGPTAAAAGAKPLTVEDVRAAYRDLFAVIGDEKGKEELRTVLAKAGSATVSDLKPEGFPAVVRSLNAATILAKSKVAAPAAAAPAKDPLL
jgi:hypothetical protein